MTAVAKNEVADGLNERLAYRQQCIERWREYMEGWTPERGKHA